MSTPQSPLSESPSSSESAFAQLVAKLTSSAEERSAAGGSATSLQSESTATEAVRNQVVSYVSALDDSEFAQLVADARGTNAKDAAAAALEQFIRHR